MNIETGWLDPAGDFYQCDVMDHHYFAECFLKDIKNSFDDHRLDSIKDPEEQLENAGWVKITRSIFNREYSVIWGVHKTLSEYQKNYLRPIFENKDVDLCFTSICRLEKEME